MTDSRPEHRSLELANRLRWPAVAALVAVLVFIAFHLTCRSLERSRREAADSVARLGESAAGLAERFRTGTITTTFVAAIPRLAPGDGVKLELAAFEATESFTRSDDRRMFFDLLPLGTTVSEIRVPVTYRYHLRLDEPWRLEVHDHSCVVHAPPIRPSLPPAIHTDRMEKRITSGWLRFDDAEQMTALEKSITPALSARAGNRDHLELIRDRCRTRVAEFVRNWLLAEDHWREDRFSAVVVLFPGEETTPVTQAPTLVLEPDRD